MDPLHVCHHAVWWWSGTFPAFLSFHSFKTCRSDILIRVSSRFKVFLPVLSLLLLWTLHSFISLRMLSSLMSWGTSVVVLYVKLVTVMWRVLSSPSSLQGKGFLNSLTSFLCPLVRKGFNTLHFDNLYHLHWVNSMDPGHHSFLDHLVCPMHLAHSESTCDVVDPPGQHTKFFY